MRRCASAWRRSWRARDQSLTARHAVIAKEKKSLTAKDAMPAKENKSLTAKAAEDAKATIINPRKRTRRRRQVWNGCGKGYDQTIRSHVARQPVGMPDRI